MSFPWSRDFQQLFQLAEQHRAKKIIIVMVEISQCVGIVIDSLSLPGNVK